MAQIFEKAEADLAQKLHPDPYIGKAILHRLFRKLRFIVLSARHAWWLEMVSVFFDIYDVLLKIVLLRERNIPVSLIAHLSSLLIDDFQPTIAPIYDHISEGQH